jgi:hypothetical protein
MGGSPAIPAGVGEEECDLHMTLDTEVVTGSGLWETVFDSRWVESMDTMSGSDAYPIYIYSIPQSDGSEKNFLSIDIDLGYFTVYLLGKYGATGSSLTASYRVAYKASDDSVVVADEFTLTVTAPEDDTCQYASTMKGATSRFTLWEADGTTDYDNWLSTNGASFAGETIAFEEKQATEFYNAKTVAYEALSVKSNSTECDILFKL